MNYIFAGVGRDHRTPGSNKMAEETHHNTRRQSHGHEHQDTHSKEHPHHEHHSEEAGHLHHSHADHSHDHAHHHGDKGGRSYDHGNDGHNRHNHHSHAQQSEQQRQHAHGDMRPKTSVIDDNSERSTKAVLISREDVGLAWGFSLHGGKDCSFPIQIKRIQPGMPADGIVSTGDIVQTINGADIGHLNHEQVIEVISACGKEIRMEVSRSIPIML